MMQDERWQMRYDEVKNFILDNKRNPSKHRIEEHDMLNWLKANRKYMNADALKEPRHSKFKELLALVEENKSKNQFKENTINYNDIFSMPRVNKASFFF